MRSTGAERAACLLVLAGCLASPEADPPVPAAVDRAEESWAQDVFEDLLELGHHAAPASGDLSLGAAPAGDLVGRHVDLCGAPVTPPAAAAFVRLPYLQRTGATATSIAWRAPPGPPAAVHLWSPGAADQRRVIPTREADAGAPWIARAEGLRPGSVYCYQLVRGGEPVFGPVGFRTAPAAHARTRLAVFGDMGYRTVDQAAVLAQLARAPVDLALLAGDIAYEAGRPDELERNLFAVYAPIMARVPFFPAAGNHDYRTDDAAPLRAAFDLPVNGGEEGRERWYSFPWGPLHVAVLDTERLVPAQLAWLDGDLRRAARPFLVAVLHRPPFSAGHHGGDPEIQELVHPILSRHRVSLAFAGHDHDYERTIPVDGVTYVVTGGGGRGTKPVGRSARTAFAARVAHLVIVEADAGELRLWAVDARGRTFDTARFAARHR